MNWKINRIGKSAGKNWKSLALGCLLAVPMALSAQEGRLKIEGTMPDDCEGIWLEATMGSRFNLKHTARVLDSCRVEDGKFFFDLEVGEGPRRLGTLRMNDSVHVAFFILEEGEITLRVDALEPNGYTLSGTPANDDLYTMVIEPYRHDLTSSLDRMTLYTEFIQKYVREIDLIDLMIVKLKEHLNSGLVSTNYTDSLTLSLLQRFNERKTRLPEEILNDLDSVFLRRFSIQNP